MQFRNLQLTKAIAFLFLLTFSFSASAQKAPGIKSYQKISNSKGSLGYTMTSDDKFGDEVVNLGDINGDGVDDLAVGADFDNTGANDRGAFYVLFMNKDNTVKSKTKNSSSNLPFTLPNGARFGIGLAALGDFDKDGVNDVLVGALGENTYSGAVYVCFLKSDGSVKSAKRITEGVNGFSGDLDNNDLFGHAVASIGDVDGDGVNDIAVGAPGDDDGGLQKGGIYIIFMKNDATVKGFQKISDKAGNFGSYLDFNDYFGLTIEGLGDFNGDNIPDIAVGSPNDDDNKTDAGAAYLLYLNSNGTVKQVKKLSGSTSSFGSNLSASGGFGVSIAYLKNFNFPNIRAFAIGAYNDSDIGTSRGAVYLVLTDTAIKVVGYQKISDSSSFIKNELDNGDKFGTAVADYGNFDTSSTHTIVVGAPFDDDGTGDAGAIYFINIRKYNVELDTLLRPRDSVCANATEPVQVILTNKGFGDLYNIPVRIKASGAASFTLNDTIKGPLKAGATDTLYFKNNFNTANSGSLDVKVYLELPGDIFPSGDSLMKSIYVIPALNAINLGKDTNLCVNDVYVLDAGNAGATFKWSTGATSQTLNITAPGKYWVEARKGECSVSDTVVIGYYKTASPYVGKDTTLCLGDSITLDLGYPDAKHSWTRVGSSFVQNTQKLTVKLGGTYIGTVRYGHCEYKDTIKVDFLNIIVNLGNDVNLCEGDVQTLDAKNAGSNFLWSTGETTQTINVTQNGTYWVRVSKFACSNTDTIKVSFTPVPQADLGKDTIMCEGEALILDAGNPGSLYQWNGNSSDNKQTKQVTTPGIYYVKVSNPAKPSCFSIDSITVTYTVLNVNLGPDRKFCHGQTFTLNAGNPGSTYEWSTGEVTQQITINKTDTYSVIVKSGRCEKRDTVIIEFRDIDSVDFGLADTITLCAGETITLDGGNPGAEFNWSTGANTQTLQVTTPGRYWVHVTVDGGNCVRGDTVYVRYIYLNVDLGKDSTLCTGETITLNAENTGAKYRWSTGDTVSSQITVAESGTYWVEVSSEKCVVRDTVTFTFMPAPDVDLGPDTVLCWGDTLVIDAGTSTAGNYQYEWYRDGISLEDTTRSIKINQKGRYALVAKGANCNTYDEKVVKYHNPFNHVLPDEVYLCGMDSAGVTLDPGPAESYLWLPTGDTTRTIFVNEPGKFTFVMTGKGGCTIFDSIRVHLCPPTEIYIPSAFTPNDDDINPVFRIYNLNADNYEMIIYNRWGEEMWRTQNPEEGWDGTWDGKEVQEDVYMYVVTYRLYTEYGKPAKKIIKGTVTLFRH